MTTCVSCGWEIHLSFGYWADALGNYNCTEKERHQPRWGK